MKHLSKNHKLNALDFSVDLSLCKESCELALNGLTPYCTVNPTLNGRWGKLFPNKLKRNAKLIKSDKFVETIVSEIIGSNQIRIRIYAFGDLSCIEDLEKWNKICKRCKKNEFWLSTRQDSILYEFFENRKGKKPENMNILYSMPLVKTPEFLDKFLNKYGIGKSFITTKKSESNCHASKGITKNSKKCGSCTRCWNSKSVTYFNHGHMKDFGKLRDYLRGMLRN